MICVNVMLGLDLLAKNGSVEDREERRSRLKDLGEEREELLVSYDVNIEGSESKMSIDE